MKRAKEIVREVVQGEGQGAFSLAVGVIALWLFYPFFIAYTADGRPEVVCFGCTTQAEIWAAWITACQMGGICASSVRVVGGGGGRSGSSDNMLFPTPGDPNDIGSVTPSTGSLFFEMPDGGGGGDEPPNPCDED